VAEEADAPEHRDAEEAAEDQRAHQQVALDVRAVEVEQASEPGRPLPEEELADDRADDRQTGRDAQPDEDIRDRVRKLQLEEALQPPSLVQREEVVTIGKIEIITQTTTRAVKS
jgi:hypothetical protein